jgi:Skp family chaperone for outer membrane proteins
MKNHVCFAVVAAALTVFTAGSARAQADHKPGGLNRVAHDVSNTAKRAGRDTKAEVKRDASKTHHALQDAGNETKTVLKKTTGIKGSNSEQPGGVNKVARDVSRTGKKAARDTRDEKDRVKSKVHGELTETGKEIKGEVKKP